jgi:hypothetical protein
MLKQTNRSSQSGGANQPRRFVSAGLFEGLDAINLFARPRIAAFFESELSSHGALVLDNLAHREH